MKLSLPRLAPADITENSAVDDLAQAFAWLMRDLHRQQGGSQADADAVSLAAWHVSRATSDGHSCVSLQEAAEDVVAVADGVASIDLVHLDSGPLWSQALPGSDAWIEHLARSPVVAQAGACTPFRPLVLDCGRLYLYRYWGYERRLATRLVELNSAAPLGNEKDAAALLPRLFSDASNATSGDRDGISSNLQQRAAAVALTRRLCVISGGPGTGKTTTVVKMLAIVLSLQPDLRIALTAPTGKAAARMQESIRRQTDGLQVADDIKRRLPAEAFTVHRLLGYLPGRVQFRHHRGHPLGYDVVVVDEASMLDLALAAKLVDALPERGRLILLGDQDQLAAVETGAVFAEICATPQQNGASSRRTGGSAATMQSTPAASSGAAQGLSAAVIRLKHSFRFSAASSIGRIARCVNQGDAEAAIADLAAAPEDVAWQAAVPAPAELALKLVEGYRRFIDAMRADAEPHAILDAFESFRVLCALRDGPRGAAALNARISERFRAALNNEPQSQAQWFPGRPVLVTRNDYVLKVFNGDVGIALPATGSGDLLVHFAIGDDRTRTIAPTRLPDCETAFAMTIHKAQGSEFDGVDIVLPARDNRVLTRELIYTAMTRARHRVRLWGSADVIAAAILRRTRRHSGLAQRLGNAAGEV